MVVEVYFSRISRSVVAEIDSVDFNLANRFARDLSAGRVDRVYLSVRPSGVYHWKILYTDMRGEVHVTGLVWSALGVSEG